MLISPPALALSFQVPLAISKYENMKILPPLGAGLSSGLPMAVEANIEAKSNLKMIVVLEIIHKNLNRDSYLNSFSFKATFLLVTF